MTKGLKALEKLTNYKCSCMSEKNECKQIIEQELKESEKNKKALEIIKAINLFSVYESIEGKYYLETNIVEMELMKENYELFKEVLSHEE